MIYIITGLLIVTVIVIAVGFVFGVDYMPAVGFIGMLILFILTVIWYFAPGDKTPTNNNIEYVDSLDSSQLKYPFIIKDGEVYQLTEKINWEVME